MTIVQQPTESPSPLGLTCEEFERVWRDQGLRPRDGSRLVYTSLFRQGEGALPIDAPVPSEVLTTESPEGPVTKFLLPLAGSDLETESVIIPMRRRDETIHTLCVSSQVGCAMGCDFCETAQMGLMRQLSASEIVAQWFAARHHLGIKIRNIVFMGMGEPLDNLDSVLGAISVLTDHYGPSISMRRTTVSTVGKIDGLVRLREQVKLPGWRQLNLAVSLNAPNDEIRSQIMPINRAMPLSDLIPVLEDWPLRKSGRIMIEYVLIPGVNDEVAHADELAALVKNIPCCVNVIPYNPRRDSPWPAPSEASVWRFLRKLESHGQFCKKRRTKGRDTMAACGQLGNKRIRGRRLVPLATDASCGP